MVMADANTMIRCIIGDDEQKIQELQEIRSTQKIIYTLEVVAEVVYVLTKVYNVSRKDTSDAIQRFLKARNIVCSNNEIAVRSLQLFGENHLDFVDNVLLAYHQLRGIAIYSYDRKLINAMKQENI
ncbi:MAG: type II toxin-antitoxin system VapC family toxin [Lachnospiraceae bacterium]|nr:type II toxin-antitoxin system VapC family toxin [Lachnospiraceae bacterium]